MSTDYVNGIPNGVIEVGGAIVFVLAQWFVWNLFKTRRRNGQSSGLVVAGEKSDKSILWGDPPHDFGGEVAKNLSHLAFLPEPTNPIPVKDVPSLKVLASIVSTQSSMSTLRLRVLPRDKAEGAPAGIFFSLRADCVRPSLFHVSQAGWNRKVYEMDEWVETPNKFYNNMGLWADMTEKDVADRKDVDTSFWPEKQLEVLQQDRISSQTKISVDGEEYLLIAMEPEREPRSNISTTARLWIDTSQLLLRKVVTQYFEDGVALVTDIVTFSDYGSTQKIEQPEWTNMDANDVIVRTDVCAVEHW